LLFAFLGITGAHYLDMPVLDGVASIGIALLLGGAAIFLARESKGLLMGEPAAPKTQRAILRIAGEDEAVENANGIVSVHLGPEQILVGHSIDFRDDLSGHDIEIGAERIEKRIREKLPEISAVFVRP